MAKLNFISLCAFLIVGLLVGGVITYLAFPKIEIKEVEKIVYKDKIVEVEKIVTKEVISNKLSCPNREEARDPNKAYVVENGQVKEAGSKYKNIPSKCARLHNRSVC